MSEGQVGTEPPATKFGSKAREAGRFVRKLHNDRDGPISKTVRWLAARDMRFPSADTLAQLALGAGILIALVIAGAMIVQRFRGGAADTAHEANELITNFQEMHSRGDITVADYRKIKSVLGEHLHSELKDDKDKG